MSGTEFAEVLCVLGSSGSDADQFQGPEGVACNSQDHLIVADSLNDRIKILTPDGKVVRVFGSTGSGRTQFRRPSGVAVDETDRIFIVDTGNHRVQVYSKDGYDFVGQFGSGGLRDGNFLTPIGIAVETYPRERVYVTDCFNDRVQIFDTSKNTFPFVNKLGRPLRWPVGVASNEGKLYVSSKGLQRVLVYDVGKGTPGVTMDIGWKGSRPGTFDAPRGMAAHAQGNLFVCDTGNHRVQVVNPRTGNPLTHFGSIGRKEGQFMNPSHAAFTTSGRLVVTDFNNDRLQVFNLDMQ